jgi:Mce-associated membrane protein
VEVADGGTGGQPVTPGSGSPVRLNIALYVLALLLACGCVFGGVLVYQAHLDRERDATEQARYGDVLGAAENEVEAFINIDYTKAQESIDAVAAGATGDFKKQYDTSTDGVIEVLKGNKSVMDGKVLWAGVVNADADSATVIAATTGTVANASTRNKPVARNFRLKLDLVREGDTWLTNNLEFVG